MSKGEAGGEGNCRCQGDKGGDDGDDGDGDDGVHLDGDDVPVKEGLRVSAATTCAAML